MKNSTLKKVNELHQQIDKVEQEIHTVNEKIQAQQKVNPMDYATNETVINQPAAMNKISKLFREVEEIKNVVQVIIIVNIFSLMSRKEQLENLFLSVELLPQRDIIRATTIHQMNLNSTR